MKTTVLRNNEDLLNFMRNMWPGFPNKKNPANMDEACSYLKVIKCELPKKYPCHVVFSSITLDDDDVGFGSYSVENITYTYKEDYEKKIKAAQKKLDELVWLEKYFY